MPRGVEDKVKDSANGGKFYPNAVRRLIHRMHLPIMATVAICLERTTPIRPATAGRLLDPDTKSLPHDS